MSTEFARHSVHRRPGEALRAAGRSETAHGGAGGGRGMPKWCPWPDLGRFAARAA